MPFARAANGRVSNLIVRIIEGECTCFNTKKRVPYRIVVETIEYYIYTMIVPMN